MPGGEPVPRGPAFDLQAHSTRSDGELEPAAVIAAARDAGVTLTALTDHDTVAGVPEALAAGARLGVRVVPAVEISALDDGEHHVLGYLVDPGHAGLGELLAASRADRDGRIEAMCRRLEDDGLSIDRAGLDARRAAGEVLGRPHLAEAVLAAPENAARLAAEGTAEPGSFFGAYLVPGAPGFVPRDAPSVAAATAAIHAAGGVAVWAHPFERAGTAEAEVSDRLDHFAELGIDGVEAFYVLHTAEQARFLARRAAELGLLTTGSADFHGPGHAVLNAFGNFALHGCEPRLGPIGAA